MAPRLIRSYSNLSSTLIALAWIALVAFIGVCYFNATMNHFYGEGGSTDGGWFSGMIWRTNASLPGPLFLGYGGKTYFGAHFSPILILPMALSWVFSKVSMVPLYAITIGSLHAITNACFARVSYAAMATLVSHRVLAHLLALTFTLTFAFGALQAVHAGLPHFEIALVGPIVLFLYAILCKRYLLATCMLTIAFTVREDAGVIASFFLAPYVLWQWRQGLSTRMSGRFLLAALAVSTLILFVLIPHVFHGYGLFRETYIGIPAFSHLTSQHFRERTLFLLYQNNHIILALLAIVAISVWFRQTIFLIGAVGAVPWILIHTFLCTHYTGGTLSYYYSFPVLITIAWPFIAIGGGQASMPSPEGKLQGLASLIAVMALACAAPIQSIAKGDLLRPYKFFSFQSRFDQVTVDAYTSFFEKFSRTRAEFGRVWVSLQVASHAPQSFRRTEWLYDVKDATPERRAVLYRADTVIVFERVFDCPEFEPLDRSLYDSFQVSGTRLNLLRRKGLAVPESIASLLTPTKNTSLPMCVRDPSRG